MYPNVTHVHTYIHIYIHTCIGIIRAARSLRNVVLNGQSDIVAREDMSIAPVMGTAVYLHTCIHTYIHTYIHYFY